jgi:hypothetical protein
MNCKPSPNNGYLHEHAAILLHSFHHWTGRELIVSGPDEIDNFRRLFTAPIVVVSHGTHDDPIFNYGNALAMELFEMEWEDFTRMPSRKSAELANRAQRARILTEVAEKGFSAGYGGIRISASGRRFRITDATLWNLLDKDGGYYGQAACFQRWEYV